MIMIITFAIGEGFHLQSLGHLHDDIRMLMTQGYNKRISVSLHMQTLYSPENVKD